MRSGQDLSLELVAWISARGITREQAAPMLGVSLATLRHWMEGRKVGTPGMLLNLIHALDDVAGLHRSMENLRDENLFLNVGETTDNG